MTKLNIKIIGWVVLAFGFTKSAANDTLSLKKYLDLVFEYHPLILKANINDDLTEAFILKGKGALDPKVFSDFDRKQFDETNYFTVWQSEAKIPTKLPIDFSLGYERNNGDFLNKENTVPSNGLVYGTFNLSLLKGFLFDEQRYNLQSAELKGLKTQIEKEILIREIIYQATYTYLEWASNDNALNILQDYLGLVNERHQNIIQLFVNGDSPAIDTIESTLNINSAQKLLLDAQSKLIKTKQKISLFIWNENGQALQLNSDIKPMSLNELILTLRELSILIDPNFYNDPLIAKVDTEIQAIEMDSRLERENLKPQLDLKYNSVVNLGKETLDPSFNFNNYKYGVAFQYPILNRKSRGQLKINEAITAQNELDKVEYIAQLKNKYDGLIMQRIIMEDLLITSNEKLSNSQLLYDAERLKFNLGESSVFLLNQRERKLLEAQTDLVKSYQALGKVFSELYYLKLGQL